MKTKSSGRSRHSLPLRHPEAITVLGSTFLVYRARINMRIAAMDATTAIKDYREQRENGDKRDDPKDFPAAGFDGLDIESSEWPGLAKWPDDKGRYWWRLKCKHGCEINDYYWMPDNVRGFPDKADDERYWFSVHHAPSRTKIEGFSARPDREKGYPDKDGDYWFYIQYDECGPIKQWMQQKDENYEIRTEQKQNLHILNNGGLGIAFFAIGLIGYRQASEENYKLQILSTLFLALGLYIAVNRAEHYISCFSGSAGRFFETVGGGLGDGLRRFGIAPRAEIHPGAIRADANTQAGLFNNCRLM